MEHRLGLLSRMLSGIKRNYPGIVFSIDETAEGGPTVNIARRTGGDHWGLRATLGNRIAVSVRHGKKSRMQTFDHLRDFLALCAKFCTKENPDVALE